MGNLNNGLFGAFNGRVGNLVGYTLHGKNVIRMIGHTTKSPTLPKLANYQKMTVVNEFLVRMQDFIKLGFQHEVIGTDRNTYNEALSYNKKHALTGEYPNISIDYPKAMLSKGSLRPADQPGISKPDSRLGIEFKWEMPEKMLTGHRNDRAMLLIYFPESKTSYSSLSGARRHEGTDTLYIDGNLYGAQMEAYITFISPGGEEISDSVYAGSIAKEIEKPEPEKEILKKTENTENDRNQAVKPHQARHKAPASPGYCAQITQPLNLFQHSIPKNLSGPPS
ncbi:DUF6266 family protein [Pedobacter gandavensis]|uniref:DUF6266 family protein n=1 Tax=Pedobacter gandavensis TaxID=2679963 RepID=UPI00292E3A35|nr:DUF6266 family protein [Pedobacter gandavensis]